jgi:hypothetical protein
MKRYRFHPSRRLAGLLAAIVPFLIGGNACMVSVLMGHGPMTCLGSAQVATAAPACHAKAPREGTASPCRSKDGSCCELKPLAADAARVSIAAPSLDAPRLAETPAVAVPQPIAAWHGRIILPGAGPPGAASLAAHRGRAPPLS